LARFLHRYLAAHATRGIRSPTMGTLSKMATRSAAPTAAHASKGQPGYACSRAAVAAAVRPSGRAAVCWAS